MKFSKKFIVKIPKDIKIIYYTNQNFIVLIGPLGRKILKLELKLILKNDFIYVTKIPTLKLTDAKKKIIKPICGTTVALLKQSILETSVILSKKLQLVGVGYKVFPVNLNDSEFLQLKLGFSHSIFYKIPETIKIKTIKSVSVYIFCNSNYLVSQIAATLRSYKLPEPYKGKGILYDNEKILLKEGKKV